MKIIKHIIITQIRAGHLYQYNTFYICHSSLSITCVNSMRVRSLSTTSSRLRLLCACVKCPSTMWVGLVSVARALSCCRPSYVLLSPCLRSAPERHGSKRYVLTSCFYLADSIVCCNAQLIMRRPSFSWHSARTTVLATTTN